jgi:hypothetical protein
MGFFCLHMMRIAIELAKTNKVYESMATKFFEHFIYIGGAMKRMGGRGYQLWDEEDGFFYDLLRLPDGGATRRSARRGGPDPARRDQRDRRVGRRAVP